MNQFGKINCFHCEDKVSPPLNRVGLLHGAPLHHPATIHLCNLMGLWSYFRTTRRPGNTVARSSPCAQLSFLSARLVAGCLLSQTQSGVTAINKPFSIRRRGRHVGFIAEWCSTSKWLSHCSLKPRDTPFILLCCCCLFEHHSVWRSGLRGVSA